MKPTLRSPFFLCVIFLNALSSHANSVWPRPTVVPLPDSVAGVSRPVISLNGTWKFTLTPPSGFWQNSVDPSAWSDIQVPGEPAMQGFAIMQNTEYPYKKTAAIPADFAGKKIFLRFDGVYSQARVWVNGTFMRSHYGGFTSWNCDITPLVTPGQNAVLTVAITDRSDDISIGSLYAKHFIGGILRNVTLFAVPQDYCTRVHVETNFDASYTNATLKVWGGMAFSGGTAAALELRLANPAGTPVSLSPSAIPLSSSVREDSISIPVAAPIKWDAEHPNLYTLTASVRSGAAVTEVFSRKIGFRKVVASGNRLLVNGAEVKLRGGCMHSMHPLLGRVSLDSLAEQDVLLYKNANVNFIRTSHYPPLEQFLAMCDKHGVYVEDEAAVCFLGQGGPTYWNDASKDTMFMEQFGEQIESHRSHPSVIIWSLGNESNWGSNFQLERSYATIEDPSRPVIFSYPTWGAPASGYDIYSNHYPAWNGALGSTGKPQLHDEFAHVPCYNLDEQKRDPGVRNFWGESIKRFWESMFAASGCLGGAIWGTIDEVFHLPGGQVVGYGEWGIFDVWRRPKPEYWLTKKTYSPIRIANAPLPYPGTGSPVPISIKNWFDHTNLNEVRIEWTLSGSAANSGTLMGPSLAPHANGTLLITTGTYALGDKLHITFIAPDSITVDEFDLTFGQPQIVFPAPGGSSPAVSETASSYTVQGTNFSVTFSKITGLISEATAGGAPLITGGPLLNLAPIDPGTWSLASINVTRGTTWTTAVIAGSYGSLQCTFIVRIDGNGLMRTVYSTTGAITGNSEAGIIFEVPSTVDTISWQRRGLWDFYPADHIGRIAGSTPRLSASAQNQQYRQAPSWPWGSDSKNYFLYSNTDQGNRGTNDFRSTKENIYAARALLTGSTWGVRVESDGNDALRMEKGSISSPGMVDDRSASITYTGTWLQYADAGDWAGTELYNNTAGASAEYTFTGTSIAWISVKNNNMGIADVYIDNVLAQQDIDCYSSSGKIYQQTLFSRSSLTNATHTIRVVVKGTRNASSSNTYIVIDAFSTQDGSGSSPWKMIVNNQWYYPLLDWGNYEGSLAMGSPYTDSVSVRLLPRDSLQVATGRDQAASARQSIAPFVKSGRSLVLLTAGSLRFFIPAKASVRLELYGLDGKRIMVKRFGVLGAGYHAYTVSAADRASLAKSVYLYRFAFDPVVRSF